MVQKAPTIRPGTPPTPAKLRARSDQDPQNPPRDPPKPDKLRPRSDQDLPSWGQDGHLVAILAHLGRDFAHLGASFAGIFRKFVATSGEGSKNCPKSPSGPSFFVFLEPPDDDFHHFLRCVFFVFVSVVHLRFLLQFFFQICFPAPEVNQRYASRL